MVNDKTNDSESGVCVVDSWFTASPGLSQTDQTLGWMRLHTWCRTFMAPRINQLSPHTLHSEIKRKS